MTSEQDVFIQNLRTPETMIQDIADEFDMTTEKGEDLLWEWVTTYPGENECSGE